MFSTLIFLGDYCLGFYLYTASMRAGASKGMGEEKEEEITKALLVKSKVVVVVEDVVTTKALLTRTRAIKWRDMGEEVDLRKEGNSIFTDLFFSSKQE